MSLSTPPPDAVRRTVERMITERGLDLSTASRMIGRNPAYLQQFIKRGTPRRLPEEDRLRLVCMAVTNQANGAPAFC